MKRRNSGFKLQEVRFVANSFVLICSLSDLCGVYAVNIESFLIILFIYRITTLSFS